MEAGFNLLSSSLSGGNLIHDLGYIASGMTSSLEMLVLCNETVGMVKHFIKGIEFNADTLAMDVIEAVGPGGNFFATEHTFKHFKDCMYFPELLNRQSFDLWEKEGSRDFYTRANEYVKDILKNHKPAELAPDRVEAIKAISARRDAEIQK